MKTKYPISSVCPPLISFPNFKSYKETVTKVSGVLVNLVKLKHLYSTAKCIFYTKLNSTIFTSSTFPYHVIKKHQPHSNTSMGKITIPLQRCEKFQFEIPIFKRSRAL